MTSLMFPAPTDIGLPLQFSSWRPHQPSAILSITDSERRFCGNVLPTGAGKTLTVAGATLLMGWRTAFLTSTKMLQAQYSRDLSDAGLVDIRGQASYRCVAFDDEHRAFRERAWQGCDEGPCRVGHACSRKPERDERDVLKGCESYDAIAVARKATLVTTNYKMWLHAHENGQGLGRFDCLVLDEAHHADKELGDFLSTVLEPADFQLLGSSGESDDVAAWARWAERYVKPVKNALEQRPRSKAEIRKYRHLKRLVSKLEMLRTMTAGDWIAQTQHGGWHFDPVFVARYASMLFRDIPHIVLTSATITRKTTAMLGIGEQELTWHEAPSDFPVARRPVYYVPCVKLDYRSDASQVRLWLATVDNFLRKRRDRKGIIHAVSYARAKQIRDYSEFADAMILHDKHDTQEQVARFKAAGPGAILVSPSVTTGYDFAYDACEYQILAKIPFPDRRSPVVAARTAHDSTYPAQIAAQEIMQAVGRGMRAADDQCECVAPETRILTHDLRWVPAHSLRVGDKLLSFNENGTRGHCRRWRWGIVEKCATWTMPRMALTLEDGTRLVCTPNHPWLRERNRQGVWRRADQLRKGHKLLRYMYPWGRSTDVWQYDTYGAGWLAGFADGEGCLVLRAGKRNPNVTGIVISQNVGTALDALRANLAALNFDFSDRSRPRGKTHWKENHHVRIKGGQGENLRFLGGTRPVRLLEKFVNSLRGEQLTPVDTLRIVKVEHLEDGPITSLQTSTKTYIAEGFGSHNTVIFDSNASWFMRSHRDLFLAWFLAAYQRLETLPDPPPALSERR